VYYCEYRVFLDVYLSEEVDICLHLSVRAPPLDAKDSIYIDGQESKTFDGCRAQMSLSKFV
jgi:hypothetical protein